MHRLIAERLLANPALITQARLTLARWRAQTGERVPSYFSEWEQILEGSAATIAVFLASPTELAARLRQSSPFTNVLTNAERSEIYEAFR